MNLKQIREKAGMTVSQLAEKLSVNETTVYRWESGDTTPRLDQFFALRDIFGSDIEALKTQSKREAS